MNTPPLTESPRSITNKFWDSTVKKSTSRHWSHKPHPRTPKILIREFVAKRAGFAGIRCLGNTYKTIEDLITHVKTLDFGNVRIKLGEETFSI